MTTYRLSLETSEVCALEIAERLSSLREADGAPAVSTYEQQDGTWGLSAYYQYVPDVSVIRSLLDDLVEPEALALLHAEVIEDEDWVSLSQKRLSPVCAGRFVVHGSHDREVLRGRSQAIEIDAGQAFGTAHHGTTRGCLIGLDRLLRFRRFGSVLDIGTGSGILAIAAAKILRRPVIVASDNDPVAVDVAKENCRVNFVGGYISLEVADGLDHAVIRARAPFDLIIANILAEPLYNLTRDVFASSKAGGVVLLSGLLEAQADKISARYRSFGFMKLQMISLDGWATLILQNRGKA